VAGPSRTDVLVVGGGPTGLLAALQAARRGLRVVLIEEEWREAGHSYALALHGRSLRLLDGLGLADEAVSAGQRLERMTLYDRHGKGATLRLGDPGARFSFVLALPQSALEAILARRLASEGVTVRWSHRLASLEERGDAVIARVHRLVKESAGYAVARTEWAVDETLAIEAAYVIGADGHRSLVRRALGVAFEEAGPSQVFAVFECAGGGAPRDELRLVLDERTTSVLWPLPGGRARWSLEVEAPQVAAEERYKSRLATQLGERFYHHVAPEVLATLLAERAPWFGDGVRDLGWSIEMRFERRLAAEFGRGRVWLAGDAAHLTGPAGMQSMNAGLAEASDLVERIARIRRGDGGEDTLLAYGREGAARWRLLLGREGGLVPSGTTPPVARRTSQLLAALPATADDLPALASQLGLSLVRA
jgi:2-polyprenyl-6-methoxyphenol hydroxylase-like FAD-dependent oxidoreductase